MIPQISDAELVLMKLLWRQGGSALYAELMEAPDIVARGWQKNTVITLLARLGEGAGDCRKARAAQPLHRSRDRGGIPGGPDPVAAG